MYEVRGIKHSVGEMNGYKYDNMNIHCLCPDDGSMDCGEPVEIVKVKTAVFTNVMNVRGYGYGDLVGHIVRFTYDKYGRPQDFEVVS